MNEKTQFTHLGVYYSSHWCGWRVWSSPHRTIWLQSRLCRAHVELSLLTSTLKPRSILKLCCQLIAQLPSSKLLYSTVPDSLDDSNQTTGRSTIRWANECWIKVASRQAEQLCILWWSQDFVREWLYFSTFLFFRFCSYASKFLSWLRYSSPEQSKRYSNNRLVDHHCFT